MKKAHLNPIGPVYCSSKSSVRMLEREMFEKNSYLRNGIELHKGSVIIDAGANIGIFTLFVNYKCQNDCQVYSFEPIPDTFEILKRNICLYGLQESVNPFNLGLTYIDGPEETEFTVYKEHDTISTMYPHVKEVTNLQPMKNSENFAAILKLFHSPYYHLAKVPIIKNIIQRIYLSRYLSTKKMLCKLVNLSTIVDKHDINIIDLLKIDVEGAEFDVVKGIRDDHWNRIKQVVVEVNDVMYTTDQFLGYLRDRGFKHIFVDDNPHLRKLGFNNHKMVFARKG